MNKVKLGIIAKEYTDACYKNIREKGLDYVEFCINKDEDRFFESLDNIKIYLEKYDLKMSTIGRWGTNRIDRNGIIETELQVSYKLIDACVALGSQIFVAGCNYVKEISYYDNITYAIQYFEKLIDYGKSKGVKIAVYNCRWNNFIVSDDTWGIILDHLKDLGIKYDPSHCIYAGGDYLSEINKWGNRIDHFHLKGSLYIDGRRVDDPPAGLDQTNWEAVMGLLVAKGYNGVYSIEPHSSIWSGELGERGIEYTINYFKKFNY